MFLPGDKVSSQCTLWRSVLSHRSTMRSLSTTWKSPFNAPFGARRFLTSFEAFVNDDWNTS